MMNPLWWKSRPVTTVPLHRQSRRQNVGMNETPPNTEPVLLRDPLNDIRYWALCLNTPEGLIPLCPHEHKTAEQASECESALRYAKSFAEP